MTGDNALSAKAIQLELVRRSGDPEQWLKLRRVAVVASCCREDEHEPLIEVMDTDPPCVIVGQAKPSENALRAANEGDSAAAHRATWQGMRRERGGMGLLWLSTLENMAGTHLRQWIWCRHRRWYVAEHPAPKAVGERARWIPLGEILSRRGLYIVSAPDKSGQSR